MKFTLLAGCRADYQIEHMNAIACGLKKLGIEFKRKSGFGGCSTEFVACWGWRVGRRLLEAGHKVLVVERGYLGNRFQYSSLAWNGLNGRGLFAPYVDDGGERLEAVATLKPWRKEGEYILLLGQVPGDQSLGGRDMNPWYQHIAAEASKRLGLPVVFRAHPLAYKRGGTPAPTGTTLSTNSLEEDLSRAKVAIAFNSNSGVDAVINGCPHICFDVGSMAWDVSAHEKFELVYPDREQWASYLAQKQWALPEICTGEPLKRLLQAIPE